MEIRQWLTSAAAHLQKSESPLREAEILLSYVIGKSRAFIKAFDDTPLTPDYLSQLTTLLQRRAHGEPIAYIVAEQEFWSLPLKVSPATLIPRPETEILVEEALKLLPKNRPQQILDLGTGTGAIALAIAHERPDCHILGIDRIIEAVNLAKENANRLNINNVSFMKSHWFHSINKKNFSMIVSNPPYIDLADNHLKKGDLRFEPASALIAKEKGLADIHFIIQNARNFLQLNGYLLIEHGFQQGEAVRNLFKKYDFSSVETYRDYSGNERVTSGKKVSIHD